MTVEYHPLGLKRSVLIFVFAILAGRVGGTPLPGFRVEKIADAIGFISSIAADSHGTLYYTTTGGQIVRIDGTVVAIVPTDANGNSGLLGMAFENDHSAIVHYTTPNQTYDIIARVDLTTGAHQVVHAFACDIGNPMRGVSPEHHGGNPTLTDDGAIIVGIGDYGAVQIAALPEWNAGKIFRINRDGSVTQLARGFRNPFDVAWDPDKHVIVVPDNGDAVDDEINVIDQSGGFFGWPMTAGNEPAVDGAIAPAFVFPEVNAPTGIARLKKHKGYLLTTYVTSALYYFDDLDAPHPIAILRGDTPSLIDVTEAPNGEIYFASGTTIYRLVQPQRGDCNGDGSLTFADVTAIDNATSASWGCDADGDGLITARDRDALWRLLTNRFPSVRRR